MRKIVFMLGFLLIIPVGIVPGIHAQEDMEKIDNSVFPNPVRPPAIFPHDRHNEAAEIEECSVCHHVYENGQKVEDESSEDMRCADCHALQEKGDTPSLMKAFHVNCKQCHYARKAGPVMCGECHRKSGRN